MRLHLSSLRQQVTQLCVLQRAPTKSLGGDDTSFRCATSPQHVVGYEAILQSETDYETAVSEARKLVIAQKIGVIGQKIIVVAGIPFGQSGSTNSMRVVDL